MSARPAVSVLLGCYNHADYVAEALDSVAAQSFRDFELIVTDDCSTDRSVEVIRRWLDRYDGSATLLVSEHNLGICAARNRALAVAGGKFVCSLAGDDWYEPDRLERQHALFASLPDEVGFVYGDLRVCSPDGAVLEPSWVARWADPVPPEGWVFDDLIRRRFLIPTPAVMIRRSALDAVGPYDESLYYEDFDMWLRLADRFQVRHLPGVVINKRRVPTSMSQSRAARPRMLASQVEVLLKWTGRNAATDRVIAARVRSAAWRLAPGHPTAARRAFEAADGLDARRRWRLVAAVTTAPGVPATMRTGVRMLDRVRRRPSG